MFIPSLVSHGRTLDRSLSSILLRPSLGGLRELLATILVLSRDALLHRIIWLWLSQQFPGKFQDSINLGRGFPFVST